VRFEIILAPNAIRQFRALPASVRSGVRDAMERHLRYEPTKASKSRIKRLRGLERPQYRLRVDEVRVFYDVTEAIVEVLAIVSKAAAQTWLDKEATPSPPGGTRGNEG
jgi:mRNA-degrading endonuclease RelE of RelBE toxin-antitoxin system